jgi:hypothetical protein
MAGRHEREASVATNRILRVVAAVWLGACSATAGSTLPAGDAAVGDALVGDAPVGDALVGDAGGGDALGDDAPGADGAAAADADAASDGSADGAPGDDALADAAPTDVEPAKEDASAADAALADGADGDGVGADLDASLVGADGVTAPDGGPTTAQECPDRAKMVYIVSTDDELLQFDPGVLVPKPVGKLSCPGAKGSPFSMGVDRWATAWVLYSDGQLFQVSTLDGGCKTTAFQPDQQNFDVFGMAFSADAPGALTEQLYVVGGGAAGFNGGPNKLATIDLTAFLVKPIAKLNPVATGADLSGNGNGELWGFFASTKPPSVRQIDKGTATTVSSLPLNGPDFAGISSWAFASWGGDFFLFSRNGMQPSTVVHRLDPSGNVAKVVPALGYTIVGAGVSSCAPTKPAP